MHNELIIWTIQRTGATTLKSRLGIQGAIFGNGGKYGSTPSEEMEDILSFEREFKSSVGGYHTNWGKLFQIAKYTPDRTHIVHYRDNSADRILSWYLANSTGAFSPKKVDKYKDNVVKFLGDDTLDPSHLIEREILDLKLLLQASVILNSLGRDIIVTKYEDFFTPEQGYGTRDIYEQLSGVDDFNELINNNAEIRNLKAEIDGKDNSTEEHPRIAELKL